MLFLQKYNEDIFFVQMIQKKGGRLNIKNWILRGHFNQITHKKMKVVKIPFLVRK